MTFPELKESPLFKLLDKKEAQWLEAYCTNGGDPRAASASVFATATDRATNIMARKMMTEPRIVPLIALWNGNLEDEPTGDEYRKELWRMARECKSDAARAALMRLYGEARGFIKRNGPGNPRTQLNPDILDLIENPKESK